MAGQVQMLESAKTKLEMSMAAVKKEHRRELSQKVNSLIHHVFKGLRKPYR